MSQERTFVPMIDFEKDYEICTEYPFDIRRIGSDYCIKEYDSGRGYLQVSLNCKTYQKHVLIAKQFIHNDDPEHKTQVDHINHDTKDYHLSNLRWVTPSENYRNKSFCRGVVYKFVDDIPDDATKILFYDTRNQHHDFVDDRYYYYHDDDNDEDIFYGRITDNTYKILHINEARNGSRYVQFSDTNGNPVSVYIEKFKYQHDLH